MALEFHYSDTPPQEYLDQLHTIDIPRLYDPALNTNQRKNLLERAKLQFKDWQQGLRDQIKTIETRYAKAEQANGQLIAIPYNTLNKLGNDLNKALLDLDRTVKAGRVVPQGFGFGTVIFGDMERGEWHLGELEDSRRWDDYITLRRRLEKISAERKPLIRNVELSQARIKEQQNDLKALMATYKARSGALNLIVRIIPVLLIVAACLFMGWFMFRSDEPLVTVLSNQIVGGLFFVIGTVGAIMMIVLVRRRTRHIGQLKQDITAGKANLKRLKAAAKQARLHFYPTDQLYKDLKAEYNSLKATFG